MGGKEKIIQPTLLLDREICLANIKAMALKASRSGTIFRPHFKTHQSLEIGRWFRAEGVDKITVSSLSMAQYFANDHWDDITVAFPVNILEMERINNLARKIKLNLLVESREAVKELDSGLQSNVHIFIKTDTGYGRTGIKWNDSDEFSGIISLIEKSRFMKFSGFLTHAGNSYSCRNREEISKVHFETMHRMKILKEKYYEEFPELVLSVGDTPTCSVMDDFHEVGEIRPGNFVFYDLMQSQIGSCTPDQIAVVLACPVVAVHKDRNEVVVYGGGVHFSKDRIHIDKREVYGQVVENKENGWGEIIQGVFVKSLSQEHGIIMCSEDFINKITIGDLVKVLPVHSCMTADLMDYYLTTDGDRIEKRINSLAV